MAGCPRFCSSVLNNIKGCPIDFPEDKTLILDHSVFSFVNKVLVVFELQEV